MKDQKQTEKKRFRLFTHRSKIEIETYPNLPTKIPTYLPTYLPDLLRY